MCNRNRGGERDRRTHFPAGLTSFPHSKGHQCETWLSGWPNNELSAERDNQELFICEEEAGCISSSPLIIRQGAWWLQSAQSPFICLLTSWWMAGMPSQSPLCMYNTVKVPAHLESRLPRTHFKTSTNEEAAPEIKKT